LATEPLATALRPTSIRAGPWVAARSALGSAARRQSRPSITARKSCMWLTCSGSSGATCSPQPGAACSTPWLRSSISACCTGWRDTSGTCASCS
jgi:hypothetical protein